LNYVFNGAENGIYGIVETAGRPRDSMHAHDPLETPFGGGQFTRAR
jgi:hypothetical protein